MGTSSSTLSQGEILFPTDSPINAEKLGKQNNEVFLHLLSGKKIDRVIAENVYGICALHSRISDLNNKHDMKGYIKTKLVKVIDRFGNESKASQYWMEEEDIKKFENK